MSGNGDTETLKSILKPGVRSRIVVETRLQRFYLSCALAGLISAADIITRSEFYRSLPLRDGEPAGSMSSLSEICLHYIRSEDFPILRREIGADGTLPLSFTFRAIGPITEFIEAYICYDDHSDIYRALVDEFGDIEAEQARLAELIRLADTISANRARLSAQSESDRWYLLKSALSAEEKTQLKRSLPQQLIFYRPTQFVPLERHFLSELCRITSVDIVIDRALIESARQEPYPSEALLCSTISFVEELASGGHCRLIDPDEQTSASPADLTAIFDGLNIDQCSASFPNTSIVEVDESEPQIVAELVSGLIKKDAVDPSNIVVVSLDESNLRALKNTLDIKQIPVVHPGGFSLIESPFPNLLRAYIDWLVHPSIESFEGFYLAPQIKKSKHLQATLNLIRASGLGIRIFNFKVEIDEQILLQLETINKLTGNRVMPEALRSGLEIITRELKQVDRTISTVRNTFHRLRYRLKELSMEGSPSERAFMARSLRQCSRILRREAAVVESIQSSNSSPVELLRLLERRVRSSAESTYLTEDIEGDAVVLTGLLDTRSLVGRTVIIVGAVEDNFFRSASFQDESPSGWMDQQLRKSVGGELPGAETLSILRNLLVHSDNLFFVYSKSNGTPPRFLERLSRFTSRDKGRIKKLVGDLSSSEGELTKGAELLLARRSGQFTEYDGLVTSDAIVRSSFEHRYAVSDLQTLLDCPHHYYFSKLLKLSEFERTTGAMLGQIGGTLTHAILKDYFTSQSNPDGVLDSYLLPWDLPEYRQVRQTILGLYLPVAETLSLALGTKIIDTERAFTKERAFCLNGEAGPISISGVIDRIDLIEEKDDLKIVAVWDYKTSSAGRQRVDGAIQVPIYALALNAVGGMAVKRGGLLFLNYPGVSEADISDTIKGPIRDQLGLVKSGRSWVVDPESVGTTLEQTKALVVDLDSKVTRGLLHQSSETETKICERCQFNKICARDELLLEQKERGGGVVRLPQLNSKPPGYRLYVDRFVPIVEILPSTQQSPAGDATRSFVVHAGAGAGKTATMVHRVISLLLAGNPISSIVTVTFTNKAAAELKFRIKRAIAGAIEREQGDVKLLTRAFYELERAQIGTIHSFCHRLLSISPNVNRDFFRPEMVDGIVLRDILEGAIDSVVEHLSSEDLNAILSSKLKIWELKAGLGTLLKSSVELGQLSSTYLCSDDQKREILKLLVDLHRGESVEAANTVNRYLKDWLPGVESWVGGTTKLSDEHRAHFNHLIDLAKELQTVHSTEAVSASYLQAFDELLAYSEDHDGAQKRKSKDNPINYWKALRDLLGELSNRIVATDSLQSTEEELFNQAQRIVSLAERAYQRIQGYKISNGLASFDDVIKTVHQFLVSGDPYSEIVRRSIKHVLIDEFQDTDAMQWEIFKNLRPSTMFIVGDYQQAIYGFRGGELSVFERAEREITADGGRVMVLNDNYRSRPAIIEFVNEFFQDLFQTDSGHTKVVARQMQPRRPSEARTLEGVFRTDADSKNNITQANRVATVVGTIKEANPGEEIAVIARTSAQISHICGALSRANLSYVVLHSGDFYDREEIKLFFNLFTWLGATENYTALVGALRSALIGLSDDEILKIYCDAGSNWSHFLESDHPAATALKELKQVSRRYSAVQLIDCVLDKFKLEETYRVAGDTAAISNIELLRTQLRSAARTGLNIFSSAVVANWMARRPNVTKDDLTSAHRDEQIKIMTIHGAKGLEFDNVVLPFLERRPPGNFDFIVGELSGYKLLGMRFAEGDDQKRKRTLTQQALDQQNKLKERAEERRVFYVACTRARDSLILLNNVRSDDKLDPISACRENASSSVWLKQLTTDGDELKIADAVSLYRARPLRLTSFE